MFTIIGPKEGSYLIIKKVYNHDYFFEEKINSLVEPGEIREEVYSLPDSPENPDPKLAYIPKYNTETQEFEFDTSEIPPSPEQRITALEEENLSLTEGAVDLDYRVLMLELGLN